MNIATWALGAPTLLSLAIQVVAQRPTPTGVELSRTGGAIHSIAVSPDGKTIATSGAQGDVCLLDAATGKLDRRLEGAAEQHGRLRFSRDGKRIAQLSTGLRIWNLASGKVVAETHDVLGKEFEWSPDGKWIVIRRNNRTAVLLHSESLTEARRFETENNILSVAFSTDGRRIALGIRDRTILIHDAHTGKYLDEEESVGHPTDIAFVQGDAIATIGSTGFHQVFDGDAQRLASTRPVGCMHVQHDRKRCVIQAGRFAYFFAPNAERIRREATSVVALHPDGTRWVRVRGEHLELMTGDRPDWSVPSPNRAAIEGMILTGDGRFAALFANQRWSVHDVRTGDELDVGDLFANGWPVQHSARPELVIVHGAKLEYWAIGSRGKSHRVRELELAIAPSPSNYGPQRMFRDGDTLTIGPWIYALDDPENAKTNSGVSPHSTVIPVAGGQRLVVFNTEVSWDGAAATVSLRHLDDNPVDVYDLTGIANQDRDVSPNRSRVVVCGQSATHVLDTKSLELIGKSRTPWRCTRFIDDDHVLAGNADGLSLWNTSRADSTLTLDLGGITAVEVDGRGRTALASTGNRVFVIEIAQ